MAESDPEFDIEPCPYCGKGAELVKLVGGKFAVRCTSCTVHGPDEGLRDSAVGFWNDLTFSQ